MSLIDLIWYQKISYKNFVFIILLLPFTILFAILSSFRRFLFRIGLKKSFKSKAPLVIIGGVSVGGSGKTPFCIALIKHLVSLNLKVGVISRGYKSENSSYPVIVEKDTDSALCGDEPKLIKMSVPDDVIVCVDPKRKSGIEYLDSKGVDIILSDDGLQHYAMKRDIEIIVLDGKRMFGNSLLLPAGPNREGKWHVKKADFVVVNGPDSTEYHNMTLKPLELCSLKAFVDKEKASEPVLKDIVAMSGIGNPKRFYNTLNSVGLNIVNTIDVPDHGIVDDSTIRKYIKEFPVVMTAKDAVKYVHLKNENNLYVLDVAGCIDNRFFEKFDNLIFKFKKK